MIHGTTDVTPTTNTTSVVSNLLIRRLARRIANVQRQVNLLKLVLVQNVCASNPCKNGATCVDLVGKYICQCLKGWEVFIFIVKHVWIVLYGTF